MVETFSTSSMNCLQVRSSRIYMIMSIFSIHIWTKKNKHGTQIALLMYNTATKSCFREGTKRGEKTQHCPTSYSLREGKKRGKQKYSIETFHQITSKYGACILKLTYSSATINLQSFTNSQALQRELIQTLKPTITTNNCN